MNAFTPLFQYGDTIAAVLIISTAMGFCIPFFLQRHSQYTQITIIISWIISAFIGFFLIFADDAHNDVYRYLWDGQASSMGLNVYETIPWETYEELSIDNQNVGVQYFESEEFQYVHNTQQSMIQRAQSIVPLREQKIDEIHELFQKTGFKNYYTTYPPTMQLVLWASAELFPLSQRGLKFIFYLFFLGSLYLVYQLYKNKKETQIWIPIFSLSPLLLWEGIGAAHSEMLFVFFILLSLFCFQRKYFFWTGVSLAALTWVKFFPAVLGLIFLVGIFWNNGRPQGYAPTFKFIIGGIIATILLWLPFLPFDPEHFFDALKLYSSDWRMFPFVFDIFENQFSLQIAQMIQICGTLGIMLFCILKKYKIDEQVFWTLLGYLLLSSTVFSWYFLWILPLGIFVLARKKFYILIFGLLITPCIQHFFTVWDSTNQIFYYEGNGLEIEQKVIFWGFMIICMLSQFIYSYTLKHVINSIK